MQFTPLRHLLLFLLALSLPAFSVFADEKPEKKVVEDLPYGEVLFHFFKQDYFTSLVNLLIAQETERVPHHVEDTELLSGGMYLSYGMPDKAETIFKQLLTEEAPVSVRDRAWYYLAKIAYQRGDKQSALVNLDKISAELPDQLRGKDRLMRAMIHLQQKEYQAAVEDLQEWKGEKSLQPFAQYNLGVALLRAGQREQGIELLNKLGSKNYKTEALQALKDKANLAIGFYLLDKGEHAQSRLFIDRVRLEGALSNRALLGAGWSDLKQGAYRPALIPWQELAERNVLDPTVQESMIAIPHALSKAGAHGRAAEAYERAIDNFSQEITRLDQAMADIKDGQFIEYLVNQADKIEMGWMRELKVNQTTPEPFYLDDLLSSHRIQESLKNFRDLWFLKRNLAKWQESILAYDDMLALRKQRYELYVPQAKEKLANLNLQEYQRRYTQLNDFALTAIEQEDWLAFATKDELANWEKLEAIQAQLDAQPDIPNHRALQSQVNFFKGIVLWNLNAAQPQRRWENKKQLQIVDDELKRTETFINSINQVMQELPKGFEGFAKRIETDKQHITQTQERVDALMAKQSDQLIQQVLLTLMQHQQRLDTLKLKAGFALAQIYDRAANPEPGAKK